MPACPVSSSKEQAGRQLWPHENRDYTGPSRSRRFSGRTVEAAEAPRVVTNHRLLPCDTSTTSLGRPRHLNHSPLADCGPRSRCSGDGRRLRGRHHAGPGMRADNRRLEAAGAATAHLPRAGAGSPEAPPEGDCRSTPRGPDRDRRYLPGSRPRLALERISDRCVRSARPCARA
jgi:hypothetical protein